jgi:hypothetical protein
MASTRMRRGARSASVLAGALLLLAGTVGAVGCGDDDKSPSESAAQAQSTQSPQPNAGGSPSEQVEGTANAYLSALNAADGPKACAQLNEQGKSSFVLKANESSSENRSCEAVVTRYSSLYLEGQIDDPRVSNVSVNGTEATAEGPGDVPMIPRTLRLVKEGERWLLVDPVRVLRQSQDR